MVAAAAAADDDADDAPIANNLFCKIINEFTRKNTHTSVRRFSMFTRDIHILFELNICKLFIKNIHLNPFVWMEKL